MTCGAKIFLKLTRKFETEEREGYLAYNPITEELVFSTYVGIACVHLYGIKSVPLMN